MTNMATENEPRAMEVFTFGEPEAVLDRREIFDYFESNLIDGKWGGFKSKCNICSVH